MKSEVSGHLENVTRDEMDVDSCIRNVSVQTGEEFSPQFLQNLTHRRKLHVGGESSQEYQKDRIISERTILTGNNGPQVFQKDLGISKKVGQATKEFSIERNTDNGIPTRNVTEQKRVGIQLNQNDQLIYEYHTGSRVRKKDPVNGTDMSEVWSGRGLQMEAEQSITVCHPRPQQSTYTNEICNVQAAFYQTTSLHHRGEPKMKFLCSFGGRILTRPSDGKLRYVGGETRIISIRKALNYQELMKKTYSVCNQPHIVKYQLPGEDLDALISVCSDEDFLHLVDEYNELEKGSQRLRIFLEPLNDRESPCSSDVNSLQQTDNAYKYVAAVNGIPEPSLQKRASRDSPTTSPTDSITSLQQDSTSSVHIMDIMGNSPNLVRKVPSPAQFIQTPSIMKTSCMQSPQMPVQYRNAMSSQSRVDRDRVDHPVYENSYQLDATNYNVNRPLGNKVSGTYQQLDRRFDESHQTHEDHPHDERSVCKNTYSVLRLYGQGNADFKKPMIEQNPNLISDTQWRHEEVGNNQSQQNIVPSAILCKLEDSASFVHMIKEKTKTSKCENHSIISPSDLSKHYTEWDQDTIRWMEKNNVSLTFDLDTEECQHIVSPATPLERQLSIATTVSSESGLQHSTSLETSRPDVNAENPFLITTSAESDHHILTSAINENDHCIHDLLTPSSTVFAPISSDVSLGEITIDNLGDRSMSQTSEDIRNILPPDILSSTGFLYVRDKTSGVFTPSHAENEKFGTSDSKDGEDEKKIMNGPISDATMAEIQAGIHGLQTIKNADLEELHELGCGTFGTVYHGKWRGTDVAIKRIKESCFAGKPSEQDRLTKDFWREAQILSQLHHPNVVALYGVVRDGPGGTLSTVTEYMANGSLRHVLSRNFGSLDRRKKIIIAQDAAIGMEYLHLKNIVHFDLKCDNLLVNLGDPERPVCKVGDFGLSRIKRNTLVSGGARGTLPWIAPELLDGSSSRVTEKVDVFSFGIAMWEILTGEEPYADMHLGAIIGGIVTNTLRPPIPRNCHHSWKALMEECWSNDPADRPSFTNIAKNLQAMLVTLESKTQKRTIRQDYHHNHLYKPSIL